MDYLPLHTHQHNGPPLHFLQLHIWNYTFGLQNSQAQSNIFHTKS